MNQNFYIMEEILQITLNLFPKINSKNTFWYLRLVALLVITITCAICLLSGNMGTDEWLYLGITTVIAVRIILVKIEQVFLALLSILYIMIAIGGIALLRSASVG